MAKQDVSMRRLKDSPTDQDLGAIAKVGQRYCDVCGKETENLMWLHCDSWTKWMRYGCGTNINYCSDSEECKAGASTLRVERVKANREKAEEAERNMLREVLDKPDQLPRLRSRWFNDFDCGKPFWDWVVSVVGEEDAEKILVVPCDVCDEILGPFRYTFEDSNGNRSLKSMSEIEQFCYELLDRDPEKSPFKLCGHNKEDGDIGFQSPIWDYYERQGWPHYVGRDEDPEEANRFNEAFNATKGPDCNGDSEWSYGYYIYHMPTRTCLGRFMKRYGDGPQIVQINRQELEEELLELREKFKTERGENYRCDEFYEAMNAIQSKQQWVYFCCKKCNEQCTEIKGTLFI